MIYVFDVDQFLEMAADMLEPVEYGSTSEVCAALAGFYRNWLMAMLKLKRNGISVDITPNVITGTAEIVVALVTANEEGCNMNIPMGTSKIKDEWIEEIEAMAASKGGPVGEALEVMAHLFKAAMYGTMFKDDKEKPWLEMTINMLCRSLNRYEKFLVETGKKVPKFVVEAKKEVCG